MAARGTAAIVINSIMDQKQCTISSYIQILDGILSLLANTKLPNTGIINPDAFKNCITKDRTYRLTIESHSKDACGDLIISDDMDDRLGGLVLNGGKQRTKFSFSYYDSCKEDVPDEELKTLFSLDGIIHDTKATGLIYAVINMFLSQSDGTIDPLSLSEYSPTRIIVNHHFRYTPPLPAPGDQDESEHAYIIRSSFCDWDTFNMTTVDSKDDIFNFVYGGQCKSVPVLQYKGPRKYRSVSPDDWLCPDSWVSNCDV